MLALLLIGFSVWCHFTMDPIIRIGFVIIPFAGGLMIGFACVGYLVYGRFTGVGGPF